MVLVLLLSPLWPRAVEIVELISDSLLQRIEQQRGPQAAAKVRAWRSFIEQHQQGDERIKLEATNTFFNSYISYASDQQIWQQDDYWATPLEALSVGYGDCEDYAIGKYFTLRALGVDPTRLRLMYARDLTNDVAHMVLLYDDPEADDPLILDNLVDPILPPSQRPDIAPIYSFNGDGLWLAKSRGRGKKVSNTKRLARWEEVITKIEQGK